MMYAGIIAFLISRLAKTKRSNSFSDFVNKNWFLTYFKFLFLVDTDNYIILDIPSHHPSFNSSTFDGIYKQKQKTKSDIDWSSEFSNILNDFN